MASREARPLAGIGEARRGRKANCRKKSGQLDLDEGVGEIVVSVVIHEVVAVVVALVRGQEGRDQVLELRFVALGVQPHQPGGKALSLARDINRRRGVLVTEVTPRRVTEIHGT
jgi:hypothetical protein